MIAQAAPTLDSAERLAALHALCFPRPWTVEAIAGLMEAPGVLALEGRLDDRATGFVLVRCAGDEAELLTLAVEPAGRRRGLAKALIEAAAAAVATTAETFWLEVAADNTAALALYRGAGFEPVGRRVGYYRAAGGAAVDALVMRRTLNTEPG